MASCQHMLSEVHNKHGNPLRVRSAHPQPSSAAHDSGSYTYSCNWVVRSSYQCAQRRLWAGGAPHLACDRSEYRVRVPAVAFPVSTTVVVDTH